MRDWNNTEYCREVSKELQAFLPSNVFDAHAHPGKKVLMDTERISILRELPEDVNIPVWREFTSLHIGEERLKGGLFFALPLFSPDADIRQTMIDANNYMIKDIAASKESNSRCSLLVSHLSRPEDVEQHLKNDAICGFKPYVNLNPGCDANSRISDYLPDWVLGLAQENELAITLHIQKKQALNDKDNITDIRNICSKYPKLKLILAHCGCSFNVYNTLKGAMYYTDIDNLYFDTSAVCEGMALVHMLKLFPASKFMWGTDFPISVRHGRFVGLGDYIYSLQSNTLAGGCLPSSVNTLHHGLESLRALCYAIKESRLQDNEVEGIFYDNAANLLDID